MKSGNLNFLEPSGPFQACNETALSFTPGYCVYQNTCAFLDLIFQMCVFRFLNPFPLGVVYFLNIHIYVPC